MTTTAWTKTPPKDGWYWVRTDINGEPFPTLVHNGAGYWDDGEPIEVELEFWPVEIEESWRAEKVRASR